MCIRDRIYAVYHVLCSLLDGKWNISHLICNFHDLEGIKGPFNILLFFKLTLIESYLKNSMYHIYIVKYLNLPSATRPVLHSKELTVPVYPDMILSDNSDSDLSRTQKIPDDFRSDPTNEASFSSKPYFQINKIF